MRIPVGLLISLMFLLTFNAQASAQFGAGIVSLAELLVRIRRLMTDATTSAVQITAAIRAMPTINPIILLRITPTPTPTPTLLLTPITPIRGTMGQVAELVCP